MKISVLCQILRLCKSGKFRGLLSRVMLTDSGECRAEHPTGRGNQSEAISETCSAVKKRQRRARAHGASMASVLEKQASKWLLPTSSKHGRVYKLKSPDGKDLKSLGGQQGKE